MVDPVKLLVNVHDYHAAVLQVAQTSMRSVIGRSPPGKDSTLVMPFPVELPASFDQRAGNR